MFTAKIRCSSKTPNEGSNPATTTVVFGPDYGDGKNAEWAARTPTLTITMGIVDEVADRLDVGDEITLTFAKDGEAHHAAVEAVSSDVTEEPAHIRAAKEQSEKLAREQADRDAAEQDK